MERARGAVLGEGGSEVDLRRLFNPQKKRSLLGHPERKPRTCVLPSRRPFFPDANWLIAGFARILKRPHGKLGIAIGREIAKSFASFRMTAVSLILAHW